MSDYRPVENAISDIEIFMENGRYPHENHIKLLNLPDGEEIELYNDEARKEFPRLCYLLSSFEVGIYKHLDDLSKEVYTQIEEDLEILVKDVEDQMQKIKESGQRGTIKIKEDGLDPTTVKWFAGELDGEFFRREDNDGKFYEYINSKIREIREMDKTIPIREINGDADIIYWSNCTGDLYAPTKIGEPFDKDITEEELPQELKRANNELWGEDYGSYCYLAQKGEDYVVLLVNEYDKEWMEEYDFTHEDVKNRAYAVKEYCEENGIDVEIMYGKENTDSLAREFYEDELICIVPWDTSKEKFADLADYLYENAYVKVQEDMEQETGDIDIDK